MLNCQLCQILYSFFFVTSFPLWSATIIYFWCLFLCEAKRRKHFENFPLVTTKKSGSFSFVCYLMLTFWLKRKIMSLPVINYEGVTCGPPSFMYHAKVESYKFHIVEINMSFFSCIKRWACIFYENQLPLSINISFPFDFHLSRWKEFLLSNLFEEIHA